MNVIPMLKLDQATRMVYARFDESVDRANMAMDYASTKPYYEAWSAELMKLSDGKSYGNVREMHGLSAAGRVAAIEFDDAAKAIQFAIEVVDDGAMTKLEKGIYTGISPGGRYARTWRDGSVLRYTGVPSELSLVDVACNYNAGFIMAKADGAEELVPFADRSPEAEAALLLAQLETIGGVDDYRRLLIAQPVDMIKLLFPDDQLPEMLKADYSTADREEMAKTGEAMPGGEYPIKTREDLTNAVEAYGRGKDKPDVKAHIVKRAKALDATGQLPADWEGSTKKSGGEMTKGLFEVAQLAALICQLKDLASQVNWEATYEGDRSALPARLAAWMREGNSILVAMATEETQEDVAELTAAVAAIPANQAVDQAAIAAADLGDDDAVVVMTKLAGALDDMVKVGARNSSRDQQLIQTVHDHACALGAACAPPEAGDMKKIGYMPQAARFAGQVAVLHDEMRKVVTDRDMLKLDLGRAQARLEQLERQPRAGGPVLRAVSREQDVGGGSPSREDIKARRRAEIDAMPKGMARAEAEVAFALRFG